MSRDKQTKIEEIARDLCSEIGVAVVIIGLREDGTVNLARSGKYLKNLVDKGYRKSTDVAEEIFEELETSLSIADFKGSDVYYAIRAEDYLHYKNKYIGKDTNVTTNTEDVK